MALRVAEAAGVSTRGLKGCGKLQVTVHVRGASEGWWYGEARCTRENVRLTLSGLCPSVAERMLKAGAEAYRELHGREVRV